MVSEFQSIWSDKAYFSWLRGAKTPLSDFPMYRSNCFWVDSPGPDFQRAAVNILGSWDDVEVGNQDEATKEAQAIRDAIIRSIRNYSLLDPHAPEAPREGRKKVKTSLRKAYESAGDAVLTSLYYKAMYDTSFCLSVRLRSNTYDRVFVPGHVWGIDGSDGPRMTRVMIIGKSPTCEEVRESRNFMSTAGEYLVDGLREVGFPYPTDGCTFYVTNVLRFDNPDPQGDRLSSDLVKNCMPLLRMEIALVRPDIILLLGAEAIKAILGNKSQLKDTVGQVIPYQYDISSDPCTYDLPFAAQQATYVPQMQVAHVLTCLHPLRAAKEPSYRPEMIRALRVLSRQYLGTPHTGYDPETECDHRLIQTVDALRAWKDEVLEWGSLKFALDTEFHGVWPGEPGAYIRTVQVSWEWKKAVCIEIHSVNNAGVVCPPEEVAAVLTELLDRPGVRLIFHYAAADLPWLSHLGLPFLAERFNAPTDDPVPSNCDLTHWRQGWQKTQLEGDFDTMLAAHAVEETADLSLKDQAMLHTTSGRYDAELREFIEEYCRDGKLNGTGKSVKKSDLGGYGFIPIEKLWKYAALDADNSFRLEVVYNQGYEGRPALLDCDRFGQSSREPFWRSMRASPAFLEMRMCGMRVNKLEAEHVRASFETTRNRLLVEFRAKYHWAEFNPDSVHDCRAYLFGMPYVGKFDKDGMANYQMPRNAAVGPDGQVLIVTDRNFNFSLGEEVITYKTSIDGVPQPVSLEMLPYKSTGKKPKLWVDIRNRKQEHLNSPSTDKETMTVLGVEDPRAWELRDIRYLGQVNKAVLRPPTQDDEGRFLDSNGEVIGDGDISLMTYERGLMSYLCGDWKVHANFSQTKETGRASIWQPALQNISKRRDKDYKRILKNQYRGPIRAIFEATPGYVFVEADYKGAELAGMAGQAEDTAMIEHCRRMQLPDEGFDESGELVQGGKYPHPDHYCIHSSVAIEAFQLAIDLNEEGEALKEDGSPLYSAADIAFLIRSATAPGAVHPSKWGLRRLETQQPDKKGMRDSAKCVVFGKAYGMQAGSAQRKAKEEGADITLDDAQALLDGMDRKYPGLAPYFAEARRCATSVGYLVNPFGRRRRFYKTTDEKVTANQEREAQNFPVQSQIADVVSSALDYLYCHTDKNRLGYRMVLQIHDAILFEVPYLSVGEFCRKLLPSVMTSMVPIPVRSLTGLYSRTAQPYYLKTDCNVYLKWGVPLTIAECEQHGISTEFGSTT